MSTYYCRDDKTKEIMIRGELVLKVHGDWAIDSVAYEDGLTADELQDMIVVLRKRPRYTIIGGVENGQTD